jgi:hypothetical protein
LRERVTVLDLPNLPHAVPDIWLRQLTDRPGFETIYVAALRSVGVPARLDLKGHAEIFSGDQWQPAPRPVILEAPESGERWMVRMADGGWRMQRTNAYL